MSIIQSTIKDFAKNNINMDSIMVKAQTKVKDMLNSVDFCSLENKKKIDEQINNIKILINNINKIISVLDTIKKYNEGILISLSAAKTLITVIELSASVLPTSVPPGVGIPASVIINSANLLSKTDSKISLLLGISVGIEGVLFMQSKTMKSQITKLNNLIQNLNILSSKFKDKCKVNVDGLDNSIKSLKIGITQFEEAIPNKNNNDNFYKGYVLQILIEETLDNNISLKRRYGVAINSQGIVDFTTNLTYVKEDSTIYDELKFKIDKK